MKHITEASDEDKTGWYQVVTAFPDALTTVAYLHESGWWWVPDPQFNEASIVGATLTRLVPESATPSPLPAEGVAELTEKARSAVNQLSMAALALSRPSPTPSDEELLTTYATAEFAVYAEASKSGDTRETWQVARDAKLAGARAVAALATTPATAVDSQYSSGEHRKITMTGSTLEVCDTCTNWFGFNIRWDQAPCRAALTTTEGQNR